MKQNKNILLFVLFLFLLIVTVLTSLRYGAVAISIEEIKSAFFHWLDNSQNLPLNERIFLEIRLPRTILSVAVGAILAVGGVLLQSLFRNPIVEPGMIGTSSGAAFGAAFFIVLGNAFGISVDEWSLPLLACLGGVIGTILVLVLSNTNKKGKQSIILLLLTGVAVNALFMSGVGFMGYIARDPQARSITFWNLGTLSGANWKAVQIVSVVGILGVFFAFKLGKSLNTLILGEEEAGYLGVNLKKLKIKVLAINVIMISIATSFVGVIGFIGLIVPHILRMLIGSDNRNLVLYSAILGGIILSIADFIARNILSPAELPIGIITSIVGVPIFIFLLRKRNYFF
ncbi:FecCD family ABC transporter permease [Flavobacterium davisii]|uniref:FecCD family ABC transporter permease n=1 Tax=Flavobacterium davisii TaxID=2906077 RepID=UPI0035CEF945